MKKLSICMVLLLALVLTACAPAAQFARDLGNKSAVTSESMAPAMEMPAAAALPMAPEAMEGGVVAGDNFASGGSTAAADRLVIKNANLSIIVKDPAKSMDSITQLADTMGGWVVTSYLFKVTNNEGVEIPQATIGIRVPADLLNDALAKIKAEVDNIETDVRSENVSGEDVTAQYTDLQSRKSNLEQAETALREILANATKTEDVLNVFNQLTQVRGEIEVIKGQIKYYEESSNFSAITVELISQASIKPITIAGWQPEGVARDALQALVNTGKGLVNVLIWFVILVLPILVIFYLVIRVLIWIVKKLFFRKSNKPTGPTSTETMVEIKKE